VHRTIKLLGCGFSILFGQTEMHGVISQTRVTDSSSDQSETVGRPLEQLEVKIADAANGNPVPVGQQGEICCRGYQNMLGYYKMPDATASTIDADGWLHMGDIGTMDERGYLRVTGRLKDMIIRGGLNIYPREIEELLFTHPAVAEAAVIGVPDERWGEQILAVVELRGEAPAITADELYQFCRDRMSSHKAPTQWVFIDRLPMTPTGKVQKFLLREQFASGELSERLVLTTSTSRTKTS
jgi:fatty-acyl-CoA synthase